MKMCRMREAVECQEVRVAWIMDQTDREVMAVKTNEGWREIMLGPTVGGDQIEEEDTSQHHTSHGALEDNLIKPLHQPQFCPPVKAGTQWFPSMVTLSNITTLLLFVFLHEYILFCSEINDDG